MNPFAMTVLQWCSLSVLIAGTPVLASSDFTGAWAFQLPDGNPAWLKVVEHPEPQAFLLWSVGSAKPVQELSISDNQIRFVRRVRWRPYGEPTVMIVTSPFTGSVIDGQLVLTCMQRDLNDPSAPEKRLQLRGRKIPPPPAAPDLSVVRFGPPVVLFNGKDLTGWKLSNPRKKNGWRAEDGCLVNETPKQTFAAYGEYGNLVTERVFKDFQLTIDYNVPAGGNSGIYLRGMYEVQVVDRDSRMQGIQGPGAVFGRIAPSKNAGRPGGEWNRYVLTLVDRHITVELNGERVIDNQLLEGCTGGGLLADDTQPGPIFLQGDHTSVRYRNIVLRPVVSPAEQ